MIRLVAAAAADIRAAAEAAYPEECCGLVVGHRPPATDAEAAAVAIVVRAVASRNVAAAGRRRDRFEVDPQLRFTLMRALAGTPLAIVGHYHSHPDQPAVPSAHDRAMAFEPALVWLIAAVAARPGGGPPAGRLEALRAWQPTADGFCELPLCADAAQPPETKGTRG